MLLPSADLTASQPVDTRRERGPRLSHPQSLLIARPAYTTPLGAMYSGDSAEVLKGVRKDSVNLVMNLLTVMWWPTKEPFRFDVPSIVTKMNNVFPKREYTGKNLREHQEELRTFFVVLPDGRWAPSPKFFSMTDGNPGQAS